MTMNEVWGRLYEKADEDDYNFIDIDEARKIAYELFDDLEFRRCENCKYYRNNICVNVDLEMMWEFDGGRVMPKKDFCCSYFERK